MGMTGRKSREGRKELTNEQMINLFLYVIIYLIPFMYSPFGNESYYFPKAILLWIVSFILLLLIIKDKKIKIDLITKVLGVFIVLIFISTIFSMDVTNSIFDSNWRNEGFITFISYGIIFLAAKNYLKVSKKSIEVFLILGVIMSIYGIFQFYGIDPVPRDPVHQEIKQCYGFLGNRNFFSSYLLILLGISISRYIFWSNKKYLIYSAIYFGALIGTLTRGGWLSLAIFCFIGLLFILKEKEKLLRASIIVVTFISIFAGMNYSVSGVVEDRVNSIKEEVTDITPSSGSGRIAIWEASIDIIKAKPILGTGLSNFWDGINRFALNKETILNEFYGIVDRAHNEYLNIAATTGIPSLIAYVILIIIILKNVWSNISDNKFKVIFIVIIGYLIQASFNISVVSVAPIFWIILGIASNTKIIKDIYK